MRHILAIDQGTTSSRAIVFDERMQIVASGQEEFPQHFPRLGLGRARPGRHLVERRRHLPRRHRARRHRRRRHRRIGITNQRETTLVWERATGRPIAPRHRLAGPPHRAALRRAPRGRATSRWSPSAPASSSTPTSPAPSSPGSSTPTTARARGRARGELAFGTVDSFLIWRLTGGARHVTDATNAARTLLYDIHRGAWDPEILRPPRHPARDAARGPRLRRRLRRHPPRPLRRQRSRSSASPATSRRRRSARPASRPGMLKSTYGTGCFAVLNTGADPVAHRRTACSPPSPTSSTASRPTRSKARSSSPAPSCSGCATA